MRIDICEKYSKIPILVKHVKPKSTINKNSIPDRICIDCNYKFKPKARKSDQEICDDCLS